MVPFSAAFLKFLKVAGGKKKRFDETSADVIHNVSNRECLGMSQ